MSEGRFQRASIVQRMNPNLSLIRVLSTMSLQNTILPIFCPYLTMCELLNAIELLPSKSGWLQNRQIETSSPWITMNSLECMLYSSNSGITSKDSKDLKCYYVEASVANIDVFFY